MGSAFLKLNYTLKLHIINLQLNRTDMHTYA